MAKSAPLLERALHDEETPKYPAELQLRNTVCGLATGALQLYAMEYYGVTLDRRIASPLKAPRGINSRQLQHVGLFDGADMIDPSFGQFYTYVGLSPDAVLKRRALLRLYPSDKIAVTPVRQAARFADGVAAHMHEIEPEVLRLRGEQSLRLPPDSSLVGTTQAEKQEVLRDIWDPRRYEAFPLEGQSSSFQKRALHLAERMHELERTR